MKQALKTIFYVVFAPFFFLGFIGWTLFTFFQSVGKTVADRRRKRRMVDIEV